jgi:hypothetical protein
MMTNLFLAAIVVPLAVLSAQVSQPQPAPTTRPTSRPVDNTPKVPAVLPGRGLAEHDFFYAGEDRQRKAFIIRNGQVVWSYDDPTGKGEISDAVLLANGNVLLAHQFAVQLITPEKKVLWSYDVPKGSEVHTAVPIGTEHVLFVQNGDPAFVRVVNLATGATEKQFTVPTKNPKSVHGHFRHARLTAAGTLMLAHMDLGVVNEYDADGKILRSIPAPGAWGVTPLKDGNALIVDRAGVREVNPASQTVWSISPADFPDYKLPNLQLAWRLHNGNTVFNAWVNQWNAPADRDNAPAQALEITPDKKVVWALHAWGHPQGTPDLGPATTIQFLNDGTDPIETAHFGDIR